MPIQALPLSQVTAPQEPAASFATSQQRKLSGHDRILLRSSRFFSPLKQKEDFDTLLQLGQAINAEQGDVLVHKGASAAGVFLVIHGLIDLYLHHEQEERTIEFLRSGHCFGLETVFSDPGEGITPQGKNKAAWQYSARALGPASLLFLPASAVQEISNQHPGFCRLMIRLLAEQINLISLDTVAFYSKTAEQRVICYLVCGFDSQRLAQKAQEDTIPSVAVPMQKQDVAGRLGITPSHYSRIMKQLVQRGLIADEGNRIRLLDLPALTAYVCRGLCDFG